MATFATIPQKTSSEFRHYDPALPKRTKSKPKAQEAGNNIPQNHGKRATQSLESLLQENENNLPTVPEQTLRVQTTGRMKDVEGVDLRKCDLLRVNHRTDIHEFAAGNSHYQLRRELCDEEVMDHATLDLALNESFDGGGRDLHLINETDETGNYQNAPEFQPNNGSPNSQNKSQYSTTTNGIFHTEQHTDLHKAVEYAFSIEDIESTYHEETLAEDETFSGIVSITNGPFRNRKRSHQSPVVDEMETVLEGVPSVVSDLQFDNPHPRKRRRMAGRQTPSHIIERTYTPKPTPLPHRCDQASHLGISDNSILSPSSPGHKKDCTISLALPLTDPCDVEHRDSAYIQESAEEQLQARGHITLPEGLESEGDVGQESVEDAVNRPSNGSEIGKIVQKELSRNESCIIPSSRSQGHRRRAWTPEMGRRQSSTALRTLEYNAAPTKPPKKVILSQLQQNPISERLNTDKGPRSYFSGSNSLGTTAEDGINIDYESGFGMPCQITDLTLCAIPNDASVVTAILHLPNPNHSLNLVALGHKVIGEQGKVTRMTQLSRDSWLLLGYRCNGSPSDFSHGGNLNEKRISSAHNDAVSHETDHSNDGWDEDDENEEEDIKEHSQRKHKVWLESEEVLLLSLKDKQDMEWEEICKRFPTRSPGAVKLRYYTLKKRS